MGQAPSDYTVQQVVSREEWDGKDDPMVTFEVVLAEVPGRTVKARMKQADPPVQEGPVRGWLDLSKGSLNIAKDRPQGSSSNGSSRGEKTYERQADHPLMMARALHTSAMSSAPAYYELLRTEGVIGKAEDKAAALNTLTGIMEWLKASYPPEVVARAQPETPADPDSQIAF